MTRLMTVLALLCVFGVVSGCHASKRHAPFNVAERNVGTERLEGVMIEFEGFQHSTGSSPPKSGASQYSQFEGHWPKTAKVSWRFEADRPYMPDREAVVAVPPRPEVGPEEDLTLWFELDGERVTARAEKRDLSWIHEHVRKVEARKRAEQAEKSNSESDQR